MLVNDHSNSENKINIDECKYCVGNASVRKKDGTLMTSKEWCAEVKTCAATIDWDKVYFND